MLGLLVCGLYTVYRVVAKPPDSETKTPSSGQQQGDYTVGQKHR